MNPDSLREAALAYFFDGLPPKKLAKAAQDCADAWEAERKGWQEAEALTASGVAALREALRMLTFSPDGLPDAWPSPKIVAAALAPKPDIKPQEEVK